MNHVVYLVTPGILLAIIGVAVFLVFRRNAHTWLPAYILSAGERRRRRAARQPISHVIFAFVDHFEPVRDQAAAQETAKDAIPDWVKRYPELAARHRDSDGRPPRHTWAYPLEVYQAEHVEALLELCRAGLGEIEVHIHHHGDTSASFRARMREGLNNFARHGVCTIRGIEGFHFAFVHGDWALDNSRRDGRCCGVNDELIILRELGCFADFTFPSAPSETQPRKINSIYYATDDPLRPKSYDTGVDVRAGGKPSGDLMLIQGPLLPYWGARKFGLIPRVDSAAITAAHPGRPGRVDGWVNLNIGVVGRPEWIFVKVHCHGAGVSDREAVLGERADEMFSHLETQYGRRGFRLHYVTAREMYNVVKAAEAGKAGDPSRYFDFVLPPYDCVREG